MKIWNIAYSLLAVLLGALLFVYGGFDDSPGAQLLGLLVALAGTVEVIKGVRKP